MDKKHKGAAAELIASAWLLGQGYEVFRNISQHGKVDIVVKKPESTEVEFIDVKTLREGGCQNGWRKRDMPDFIRLLAVDVYTGYCRYLE